VPNMTFGTLVRVEDLVPVSGLAVPVHANDTKSKAAGVAPFTYKELNVLYQAVAFNSTNISFLKPMLGIHIAPRLDLEVSLDWGRYYLNDMAAGFPAPRSSATGVPEPQDGYYTHGYNDGTASYTVIRVRSTLQTLALAPTLVVQASHSVSLSAGVVHLFTRGEFAAQNGWQRKAAFELFKSFPALPARGLQRGFTAGIKIGASEVQKRKRSLLSSRNAREMVGNISAHVVLIDGRIGGGIGFEIFPFTRYDG
jgi:hypothetical protein